MTWNVSSTEESFWNWGLLILSLMFFKLCSYRVRRYWWFFKNLLFLLTVNDIFKNGHNQGHGEKRSTCGKSLLTSDRVMCPIALHCWSKKQHSILVCSGHYPCYAWDILPSIRMHNTAHFHWNPIMSYMVLVSSTFLWKTKTDALLQMNESIINCLFLYFVF